MLVSRLLSPSPLSLPHLLLHSHNSQPVEFNISVSFTKHKPSFMVHAASLVLLVVVILEASGSSLADHGRLQEEVWSSV